VGGVFLRKERRRRVRSLAGSIAAPGEREKKSGSKEMLLGGRAIWNSPMKSHEEARKLRK